MKEKLPKSSKLPLPVKLAIGGVLLLILLICLIGYYHNGRATAYKRNNPEAVKKQAKESSAMTEQQQKTQSIGVPSRSKIDNYLAQKQHEEGTLSLSQEYSLIKKKFGNDTLQATQSGLLSSGANDVYQTEFLNRFYQSDILHLGTGGYQYANYDNGLNRSSRFFEYVPLSIYQSIGDSMPNGGTAPVMESTTTGYAVASDGASGEHVGNPFLVPNFANGDSNYFYLTFAVYYDKDIELSDVYAHTPKVIVNGKNVSMSRSKYADWVATNDTGGTPAKQHQALINMVSGMGGYSSTYNYKALSLPWLKNPMGTSNTKVPNGKLLAGGVLLYMVPVSVGDESDLVNALNGKVSLNIDGVAFTCKGSVQQAQQLAKKAQAKGQDAVKYDIKLQK